MLIPIMLNMKWQTAIWIALGDSVTSEAKKAVQVVPMFEPNVSGYANAHPGKVTHCTKGIPDTQGLHQD